MTLKNPTNHTFIVRYGQWLIKWRWLVVISSLALTLGVASGGRLLGFDTDYRAFFSKENPQLNAFEAMEEIYTKNENVLMVLEAKDGQVHVALLAVLWKRTPSAARASRCGEVGRE